MEKLMQRENMFVGHASSQRSSEELDFNDVFGGPPRRFSMQEVRVRYSFGETEEEKPSLIEKPVFGEDSTPRNRRHKGDDFFDDIFRGTEEGYGSPRRGDGVFGSNPGSRIMSPAARPLTPKAEPFGTSLPSQFSLPARITTTELPTFSPLSHGQHNIDSSTNGLKSPYASSPLSRFSNQATEIKNVYRQSPLSSNEDSSRSEDNIGNQFHFSIYKWAGRGVPMLMPFVAKNNLKSKGLLKEDLMGKKEIEKQAQGFLEESLESKEPQSSLNDDVDFDEEKNEQKEVPLKIEEESLRSKPLLSDDFEQPGNVTEFKEQKPTAPKGVDSNNAKFKESNLQSGDKNPGKSGVKGKVREFVQIFSQEAADSRTKANVLRKSQSLRWKNVEIVQKGNEESSTIAKIPKERFNLSDAEKKSDFSLKVNENLNNDEAKRHFPTGATSYPSNRFSTNMKKSFSSATLHGDTDISVEDDPLENFLVQELFDDYEKVTQSESSDDLKAIDAKIQQWSVGKKENIRSLLSTLQYVLWPGSGWKAIPLVDLIEANSVKRAYQKALLRLHPDKLQQKSAASNQKYIADKVFDILQEAWDHFNTLGPL